MTLSVDIETYSPVDIKSSGLFKYAANAELILLAYSYNYEPPKCIDVLNGEKIPQQLLDDLVNPRITKWAHNAPFERAVLSKVLGIYMPPEQWRCSSVLAAASGYPLSLDDASKALGTMDKKDAAGKALIRYFCIPCKPTATNGNRTRNLPNHAPDKWASFIEYCKQDVVTEQAITSALSWVEIPEHEHALWCLDQRINERGWKVDLELIHAALKLDDIYRERLTIEAKNITGLENPNSVAQIREWLEQQEGITIPDLKAESVRALLNTVKDPNAKRIVEIRQEMGKTSIKKYAAMLNSINSDGRVRGLFQFCGAGRTWRWAGRLVQVQNLPRILMSEDHLMAARDLVKQMDAEYIEMCFGSLSNVLSQLIRTTFIAEPGHRLIISDFSAIEARVLAWIADEDWVLDVFKTHGKIYEATAANMLKVEIDKVTKADRQKGKVATLALGYGGGVNALEAMGALAMGIPAEELPDIVKAWREVNPNIVKFWRLCERSAKQAIMTGTEVPFGNHGLSFSMKKGTLLLNLPSGRSLMYPKAALKEVSVPAVYEMVEIIKDGKPKKVKKLVREPFVQTRITFMAINQFTRKWEESNTYSGKICENICQAIARDCLANAMMNLDKIGVRIVSHIHDEVVCEMPMKVTSLEEVNKMMTKLPAWAKGLPLTAAGDESLFYNK